MYIYSTIYIHITNTKNIGTSVECVQKHVKVHVLLHDINQYVHDFALDEKRVEIKGAYNGSICAVFKTDFIYSFVNITVDVVVISISVVVVVVVVVVGFLLNVKKHVNHEVAMQRQQSKQFLFSLYFFFFGSFFTTQKRI